MTRTTRSYRIRVYPNAAQRRMLDRWFGASRWLWNHALEIRSAAYRLYGQKLTGTDISRWLTQCGFVAGLKISVLTDPERHPQGAARASLRFAHSMPYGE